MALSLTESDRALRTPAARRELVLAVRDATGHEPETDAVEWKGGVDLRDARWKVEIARHAIGFANRHPDRAGRAFEGCGYLLLGVEPGNLAGITPVDAAVLEDAVTKYTGSDGPQWDADYVEIDGAVVLVVTVEPPRWGDRVFALEREFSYADDQVRVHYKSGDVFVRRRGKTERANAQEMRMLSERAAASGERLAVDVTWWEDRVTPVQPVEIGETVLQAWLDSERARLLRPTRAAPGTVPDVAKLLGTALFEPEQRSVEEYQAEVEGYLAQAKEALVPELRRRAVRLGIGKIALGVVNLTEHNFAGVGVEVTFGGHVASYFDEDEARWEMGDQEFPDPPRLWGKVTSRLNYLARPSFNALLGPSTFERDSPGWTTNENSTRIVFKSRDMRPGYQYQIGPVQLIVGAEHAGETLIGSWLATSTSASGRAEGSIEVPIEAAALPVSRTMAGRPAAAS